MTFFSFVARFSILRTFLDAGDNFVQLKYSDPNDLSDLTIHLDRSKILSHGRPAVESYLQKLQIYKSTADVTEGKRLYDQMTEVDDWFGSKLRPVVLEKKVPRKVFVQANTVIEDGGKEGEETVKLVEYPATVEGMVQSFAERDV